MTRRGPFLLVTSGVLACLLGLWTWARVVGWVPGPPSFVGEIVGAGVPGSFALLGLLSVLATRNDVQREGTPTELAIRLRPAGDADKEDEARWFLVLSTLSLGLAFSLIVSLYPRSLYEALTAVSLENDGVVYVLRESTWYQEVLFKLCLLVPPGGFLAAYFGIRAIRALGRRIALGRPVVEMSPAEPCPGARVDLLLRMTGLRRFDSLSLHLVCVERAEWRGETPRDSEEHVAIDQPVVELGCLTVRREGPAVIRRTAELPSDAMHTFMGEHNQIRWMLRLAVAASPFRSQEDFPIRVVARPAQVRP